MSSPPARGSSARRARGAQRADVVPARAGIFRPDARAETAVAGRPRPRGDLPLATEPRPPRRRSSPPARGSSLRAAHCPERGGVVPARAGIFRVARDSRAIFFSRPRPRGDLPSSLVRPVGARRSSPPARGSSRCSRDQRKAVGVVPARAGIFRVPCVVPRGSPRRPRPRGDLPRWRSGRPGPAGSSPPARGSSLRAGADCRGLLVVPARAGIFRQSTTDGHDPSRRPRPRGDLPGERFSIWGPRWSSPPARGSSYHSAQLAVLDDVVPARAGIFRSRPAADLALASRPRPRGDLPAAPSTVPSGWSSSPPARGSSVGWPDARRWRVVVPARAGIFLELVLIQPRDGGRPRPRGDLPGTPIWSVAGGASSPPARGSSPALLRAGRA